MLDVQAVILAGGRGTRLRPVTVDLPKPLIPVANRPLIEHQLRHLAESGVRDVTLALGYNAEQFEPVERHAKELGLHVQLITEPRPLGTGGALRWCADQGAFDERPLLWMNGDVVASPDVESLLEFHTSRNAQLTLWLTSARNVSEFGVLELGTDGFVERFLEKPAQDETDSHLVNAGILMLQPQLLQRIPRDKFFSFEQALLPTMVRESEELYGMFDGGYWLDTGRPRMYLAANRHVLEGRVNWEPAGTKTEDGMWEGEGVEKNEAGVIHPAAFGNDVELDRDAQLFGRTVLGNGVTVGAGAQLENCVVFDDVQIGQDAEIVNSIVCANAQIGRGVVLEQSIVGARSKVMDRNELRGTRLWDGVEVPAGVLRVDRS